MASILQEAKAHVAFSGLLARGGTNPNPAAGDPWLPLSEVKIQGSRSRTCRDHPTPKEEL